MIRLSASERAAWKRKGHKYGAQPTTVDGIRFASKAEAKRYGELKLLEKAGEIRGLSLQPKFPLHVQGSATTDPIVQVGMYVADFAYELRCVRGISPACRNDDRKARLSIEWNDVIEDVKGFKTPLYRWKKNHVEAQYGISITEVA